MWQVLPILIIFTADIDNFYTADADNYTKIHWPIGPILIWDLKPWSQLSYRNLNQRYNRSLVPQKISAKFNYKEAYEIRVWSHRQIPVCELKNMKGKTSQHVQNLRSCKQASNIIQQALHFVQRAKSDGQPNWSQPTQTDQFLIW